GGSSRSRCGRRRCCRGCGRRIRGVKPADYLGGEIKPRVSPHNSRVERAEQNVELPLLRDLLNDGTELLLELGLQLVLQLLHFLLRIVGESLNLGLLAVDVLFELRPSPFVEDAR